MLSLKRLYQIPNVVEKIFLMMKEPDNIEAFGRTLPYQYYKNMVDYNRKNPDKDLYYGILIDSDFVGFIKLDKIDIGKPPRWLVGRDTIDIKDSAMISIYLNKFAKESRSGIGTKSLEEITKIALEHGIVKLFASIYDFNAKSLKFFSKHSFKEVCRTIVSADPKDNRVVVVMSKIIQAF